MDKEFVKYIKKRLDAMNAIQQEVQENEYHFRSRMYDLVADATKQYAHVPEHPIDEFDVGKVVAVLKQSGQFDGEFVGSVHSRLRVCAPKADLSAESLETLERLGAERKSLEDARKRIYSEANLIIRLFNGELSVQELLDGATQ